MAKEQYEPIDPVTIPVEQYLYDLNQQVFEIKQSLETLLKIIINKTEEEEAKKSEKERVARVIGGAYD